MHLRKYIHIGEIIIVFQKNYTLGQMNLYTWGRQILYLRKYNSTIYIIKATNHLVQLSLSYKTIMTYESIKATWLLMSKHMVKDGNWLQYLKWSMPLGQVKKKNVYFLLQNYVIYCAFITKWHLIYKTLFSISTIHKINYTNHIFS